MLVARRPVAAAICHILGRHNLRRSAIDSHPDRRSRWMIAAPVLKQQQCTGWCTSFDLGIHIAAVAVIAVAVIAAIAVHTALAHIPHAVLAVGSDCIGCTGRCAGRGILWKVIVPEEVAHNDRLDSTPCCQRQTTRDRGSLEQRLQRGWERFEVDFRIKLLSMLVSTAQTCLQAVAGAVAQSTWVARQESVSWCSASDWYGEWRGYAVVKPLRIVYRPRCWLRSLLRGDFLVDRQMEDSS
jgi:hypothetical protein